MVGTSEGIHSMAGSEDVKARDPSLAGESPWTDSVFEQVFLQHYPRIVAVLFRLMGDRHRAEELANDVFWRLYRQPLLPEPDGNLGGWLYRTATNLGIDALRAKGRRQQYEQAAGRSMREAGQELDPFNELLREEKRNQVRAVLAELKPNQAQILILRASGLSYNELAEVLGVQRGSVGTMLSRAETEFQKRYLEWYGGSVCGGGP